MQIRVLSEFNFKLAFRNKRTYSRWIRLVVRYSIECQTRGIPEVTCAQRDTTACMPSHNTRWLLIFVPPNNPINTRALSFGHRLSLFSEVGYYELGIVGKSHIVYTCYAKRTISLHRVIDSITSRSGRP